MISIDNKTYQYHTAIDKDNNILGKWPSESYTIRFAIKHPQAVAVKKVEHTINEELVWRKEKT